MKKSVVFKVGIIVLSVICVIALSCLWFCLGACKADDVAIEEVLSDSSVSCTVKGNTTVFYPDGAEKGFVFYPGARVEEEAYIPLAHALAEKGILSVIVEMPMYFPLLDCDAADSIIEEYPEIEEWYIGGHSLGGYAASLYLEDSFEKYEGLILLASYSGIDFKDTDLSAMTIYGTEDDVLNFDRYNEGLALLQKDYTEIVIEGGCHAYFGTYTGQDESLSKITNQEQIEITVDSIVEFIG